MSQHSQPRKFSLGETATYTKTITSADIEIFAAVSGDHNPIHLDEKYAMHTRFERRIAHGMLTASFISTVIGMHLPGCGAIYLSQEIKFLKPVFIGDTVTATATVTAYNEEKRIITLKTECANQEGIAVLTGEAKVLYEPVP
ncbi:MAG: MaoC family dehydratase [Acidobacteriota bacterium]